MIHRGPGINNQHGHPRAASSQPGSLGAKVIRLNNELPGASNGVSVKYGESTTQAVIRAAYRQVFGRDVYEGQRLTAAETKLENGEISLRDFIRILAKSETFLKTYWTPFYVCKAIVYIHRRLLGRPTYGRPEMNTYFDLCSKKGFYVFVDALLDSAEYNDVFGEDTVPYERYLTPAGLKLRSTRVGSLREDIGQRVDQQSTPRFIELGQASDLITGDAIQGRVDQGVTVQREQTKTFKLTNTTDKVGVANVVRGAYRQIFERDIEPYVVSANFTV